MSQSPASLPSLGGEPVRFAVWSDNLLAADELNARLRDLGQTAEVVTAETGRLAECLVAVTHKPRISQAELATWMRLANRAKIHIVVCPARPQHDPQAWPHATAVTWTGDIRDLVSLSKSLVDLLRPAVLRFARLPILYPTEALPGLRIAESRIDLVDMLTAARQPRIVPVSQRLFDDLRRAVPAASRQDYDLSRLAHWSHTAESRALISPRIGRPHELTAPLGGPRSLDDVISDSRTRRLVLLLGEPGSGKSQQLQYFDAHAALRSIRSPDSWTANSFYVDLGQHPAQPNISLHWLAQRWQKRVDINRWCGFEEFIGDGGTLLLDGLNDVGIRALSLEEWMVRWRDVIEEALDNGPGRVVVTCRTRDQLIPMRVPQHEPPTSVSMLPLSKQDIVAIATERDPAAGRRLDEAMTTDPALAELYSNPSRLIAYLESGVRGVVTTGARLFGFYISAAILRERDRLNFHGDLLPAAAAAKLADIREARNGDPWPILSTIPLIRSLGELAKVLTFPNGPDGRARLTIPRDAADEVLAEALRGINRSLVDADRILDTARDLHILDEEDSRIRFAHSSLQHLFAASASTIEEIAELARGERRSQGAQPAAQAGAVPSAMNPPSYANNRYDEVFQFAAQLRGTEVADRLVHVDPVLAARVYLTIRNDIESGDSDVIIQTLRGELDHVRGHQERSAIIAALGDLGWRLPDPRDPRTGGPIAVSQVPAGEWRLGLRTGDKRADRSSASEFRQVEVASFRISRYPVSNASFQEFIEEGGYHDKSLWTPEGWVWRMRSRAVEQFVADWGRRRDILRRHPERIIEVLRSGRATPAGAAALLRFARLNDSDIAEYARQMQSRVMMKPKYWDNVELTNPLQPVVGISWFEANAYCDWLSRQTNAAIRLPSENEWEAACLYSLGLDDAAQVGDVPANTLDLGYPATTPIGTFVTARQTELNLPVEMLGNVFEWVFDHYAPGDHNRHIVKGGSWRQEGWRAHPAYRGRGDVDIQNDDIGFRYVIAEGQP